VHYVYKGFWPGLQKMEPTILNLKARNLRLWYGSR